MRSGKEKRIPFISNYPCFIPHFLKCLGFSLFAFFSSFLFFFFSLSLSNLHTFNSFFLSFYFFDWLTWRTDWHKKSVSSLLSFQSVSIKLVPFPSLILSLSLSFLSFLFPPAFFLLGCTSLHLFAFTIAIHYGYPVRMQSLFHRKTFPGQFTYYPSLFSLVRFENTYMACQSNNSNR